MKDFPWLRFYRKILIKFFYQFRIPAQKRSSLRFLSQLITEQSHPRLKNAVETLIENGEHIFRFQCLQDYFPRIKLRSSLKVVNESSNNVIRHLFQVQCGIRTVKNLRMRISHRLNCPIIVSPNLLATIN
ncbi:MAG: hypothetical protein ACFFAN_03300 [Promethearchaeota archaeon]